MGKNYDYPLYAPYTKVDEFHKNKQNLDEIAPVIAGAAKVAAVGARVVGRVAAKGAVAATKAAGKGVRAVAKGTKKAVKSTAKEVGSTMAQAELARQVKKQQETETQNEDLDLKKMSKELDGASKMHKGQSERIKKHLKKMKEEVIAERGDFWHPDPDKDRKLGGPGANQRAREDRAAASKKSSSSDSKKLRPGESYMDWNKRQKANKMKKLKEEGAPTMNTGTANGAAGFSAGADENGPTAGLDAPLGGTAKQPKGHKSGGKVKKRKFKCRKADDGIHQVCEGKSDPRHLAFKVELDDIDFIFYGKSPADVKIALRKIYRPERLKSMKITRVLPGEVLKYYWDKRQGAM